MKTATSLNEKGISTTEQNKKLLRGNVYGIWNKRNAQVPGSKYAG